MSDFPFVPSTFPVCPSVSVVYSKTAPFGQTLAVCTCAIIGNSSNFGLTAGETVAGALAQEAAARADVDAADTREAREKLYSTIGLWTARPTLEVPELPRDPSSSDTETSSLSTDSDIWGGRTIPGGPR